MMLPLHLNSDSSRFGAASKILIAMLGCRWQLRTLVSSVLDYGCTRWTVCRRSYWIANFRSSSIVLAPSSKWKWITLVKLVVRSCAYCLRVIFLLHHLDKFGAVCSKFPHQVKKGPGWKVRQLPLKLKLLHWRSRLPSRQSVYHLGLAELRPQGLIKLYPRPLWCLTRADKTFSLKVSNRLAFRI